VFQLSAMREGQSTPIVRRGALALILRLRRSAVLICFRGLRISSKNLRKSVDLCRNYPFTTVPPFGCRIWPVM